MQSNITQERVPIHGDAGPLGAYLAESASCAGVFWRRGHRQQQARQARARGGSVAGLLFSQGRCAHRPVHRERAEIRLSGQRLGLLLVDQRRWPVSGERGVELRESSAGSDRDKGPFRFRLAEDGQVDGGGRRALQARARSLQARRCAAERAPCARGHRRPSRWRKPAVLI